MGVLSGLSDNMALDGVYGVVDELALSASKHDFVVVRTYTSGYRAQDIYRKSKGYCIRCGSEGLWISDSMHHYLDTSVGHLHVCTKCRTVFYSNGPVDSYRDAVIDLTTHQLSKHDEEAK